MDTTNNLQARRYFNTARKSKAGFTMIEVMVVVATIGILIAILLPAAQNSRASARQTSCKNKLRQLAIAVHSFESTHRTLPAGKTRLARNEPYGELSWLQQLLPFVDQSTLWDLSQRALAAERSPYVNPPHEPLGIVVPQFACPEDGRVFEQQPASQLQNALVALTSYVGVSGTDYLHPNGTFLHGRKIRFADIIDGTSNTVMFGERPPTPDFNYGWWYTGIGQDGSGTADMILGMRERVVPGGIGFQNCDSNTVHTFQPGDRMSMCDGLHFWSLHHGGAHFALCDGSVRFMAYESRSILESMATRDGAEIVSSW